MHDFYSLSDLDRETNPSEPSSNDNPLPQHDKPTGLGLNQDLLGLGLQHQQEQGSNAGDGPSK